MATRRTPPPWFSRAPPARRLRESRDYWTAHRDANEADVPGRGSTLQRPNWFSGRRPAMSEITPTVEAAARAVRERAATAVELVEHSLQAISPGLCERECMNPPTVRPPGAWQGRRRPSPPGSAAACGPIQASTAGLSGRPVRLPVAVQPFDQVVPRNNPPRPGLLRTQPARPDLVVQEISTNTHDEGGLLDCVGQSPKCTFARCALRSASGRTHCLP